MEILCNQTDARRWEMLADAAEAPLQQRWAYGAAVGRIGAEVVRLELLREGAPLALVQLVRRRVFGVRFALASRGPLWFGDPPEAIRAAALRAIRRRLGARLVVTPETVESACRRARLLPVMTPATVARLALSPSSRDRMGGKWRNRLVAAEGAGLKVGPLPRRRLRWLLEVDLAQQRARGYRALPPGFVEAWVDAKRKDTLVLAACRSESQPVAVMMFLRHGTTATYHIGWTGAEGRATHAHNLLLWQAMDRLRADGVRQIDLGTLDTENCPGLARFKLGTGATAHRLGGTWLGL